MMGMQGWELELESRSGLLVGSLRHAGSGTHMPTATVPGPEGELALLPGSSVRGVLRECLRRFAGAKGFPRCALTDQCTCVCCELFGVADRPGKLRVSTALFPASYSVTSGVAIDRRTRTAWRAGRALWTERRGWGRAAVRVEATRPLEGSEIKLLEDLWAWLGAVGIAVGQRRSSGAGWFALRARRADATAPAIGAVVRPAAARRRYALRLRLEEPAHIVGPRQRDFYRDALETIPASTVRGAIGRALERAGAADVAEALFLDANRPVLVTPAFPIVEDALPGEAVPWVSRRRCRGDPSHVVDVALDVLAAAMGARLDVARCPRCAEVLEDGSALEVPYLVLGHTRIDPATRRAATGQLYHQVVVAPGAVFEAQLVATPEQVEPIAALGYVFVGGRRGRGMGRARLEVIELPTPRPLEERLAATAGELGRRGVKPPGTLAIIGVVSDVALAEPLASVLSGYGLEIVTGDVRVIERGGWDELNNRPRALREAIAAGSWLGAEVSDLESLRGLEQDGLPDPEGIAPLVIQVREPWEVREVARREGTIGSTDRDALIRGVRRFCREHAGGKRSIPKRSQLHNLLRYARQTDSVEEVALFLEYQATRRELADSKHFLDDLAGELRRRYEGDPDGAREYLAILVRAAEVERGGGGA